VHDSQTGLAASMSPSGIDLRRSGNVQATSYIGSARPLACVATRRNVQRRNGVLELSLGWAGVDAHGRGMRAMARGRYAGTIGAKTHQQY
jgi:hypothetical protein